MQTYCKTQYNHRKAKSKQQTTVKYVQMCVHCTVHNSCIQYCVSVSSFLTAHKHTTAYNTAQNRPDNFPSYPPDNHHYSDDVSLREWVHHPFFIHHQTLELWALLPLCRFSDASTTGKI